jgi:RNA polymerase sigma-70 factor (ECF subfamily)
MILENRIQTMPDVEHEEHLKEVLTYIDTELTPQTRTVLRMCYDEKRKYKEVASELGISVQAVNKHISQALRKLREHFNTATSNN